MGLLLLQERGQVGVSEHADMRTLDQIQRDKHKEHDTVIHRGRKDSHTHERSCVLRLSAAG